MKYKFKKNEIINPVAEMSLRYKVKVPASERVQCLCSDELAQTFRSMYNDDDIELVESSYVLFFNHNFRVLGSMRIGEGHTTGTVMDVRRAMQGALLCNATAIAICHNHPSGSLRPSNEDKAAVKNFCDACKFFEITLLDSIIIDSEKNYYSFKENGDI